MYHGSDDCWDRCRNVPGSYADPGNDANVHTEDHHDTTRGDCDGPLHWGRCVQVCRTHLRADRLWLLKCYGQRKHEPRFDQSIGEESMTFVALTGQNSMLSLEDADGKN